MKIISDSFENGAPIPERYTCEGENIHPPLKFIKVPREAESLCIIMDDLDAQASKGNFLHWAIWNIGAEVTQLDPDQKLPGAVEGKNDMGSYIYGGPCPPGGSPHRYRIRLFALSKRLSANKDTPLSEIEKEVQENTLKKAELTGTYQRTEPKHKSFA